MKTHYIDIAVILLFMISMIILGIRNVGNINGINAFALGRREFSTGALASTILATWVSGSGFLVALSETYMNGLYYFIPSLGMGLSMIIVALLIVPRMEFFLGKTSVASAMGELYGPKVRTITAVAGAFGVSGLIAVQFKVFGNLGREIFNLHSEWFLIGMGLFIIWYSRWGGIKSVVKTDIIQVIAFIIALPVVGIMIYRTFSESHPVDISSIDKFNFAHVFGTFDDKLVEMILLSLYFTMPSMNPAAIQRVSMGYSIEQVKRAWLIAACFMVIIKILSSTLPIFIYTINPELKEGQILGYIINNFSIPGIKGILIAGIIAMAMSTADSYLNISSVLIANDLWKRKKLDNADKLLNARNFTVVIGLFAILLALSNNNLLKIILFTNSFYMPIVTVPLLFAIFKYKTCEKCVLIAMSTAFITVLSFHIFNRFDPIIPGMVINALTLILGTRFFYKGVPNIT